MKVQASVIRYVSLLLFTAACSIAISRITQNLEIGRFLNANALAATLAYTLMVAGFFVRKHNREWHAQLMMAAMSVDLFLVIYLQSRKSVIQTAIAEPLNFLQYLHISSSLAAALLYIPMMVLGYRVWTNQIQASGKVHMRLGIVTFTLRTIGFFTMFAMLGDSHA